jgi:hypothetical protein
MNTEMQAYYNALKSLPSQVGDYKGGSAHMAYLAQKAAKERDKNLNRVVADWQSAYDEAKNTNLQRYEDILGGYGQRYDDAMGTLQGLGDAEKADLVRSYGILGSQQNQALVNSGLSSTTIRPAVIQQNQSAMQRALSLVNERLQGQQLNMMNQLSGDKLAFMERREDDYPDMNLYLELIRQASAA